MKTGDLVYWVHDGTRMPLIYLGISSGLVYLAVTMQPTGQIIVRWTVDLVLL